MTTIKETHILNEDLSYIDDKTKRKKCTETIKAIIEFREAAFEDYNESLSDTTYELFRGGSKGKMYTDNLYGDRENIISLMQILGNPTVQATLKNEEVACDYEIKWLAEFLDRLRCYYERLEQPFFETLFLMEDITGFPSDWELEELDEMVQHYSNAAAIVKQKGKKSYYCY